MSHFFHYTRDKSDSILSSHFLSIKAMKVKLCTTLKIIVIHILTINTVYKTLHFIRYLKEKKITHYFLNHPAVDVLKNFAGLNCDITERIHYIM